MKIMIHLLREDLSRSLSTSTCFYKASESRRKKWYRK